MKIQKLGFTQENEGRQMKRFKSGRVTSVTIVNECFQMESFE